MGIFHGCTGHGIGYEQRRRVQGNESCGQVFFCIVESGCRLDDGIISDNLVDILDGLTDMTAFTAAVEYHDTHIDVFYIGYHFRHHVFHDLDTGRALQASFHTPGGVEDEQHVGTGR